MRPMSIICRLVIATSLAIWIAPQSGSAQFVRPAQRRKVAPPSKRPTKKAEAGQKTARPPEAAANSASFESQLALQLALEHKHFSPGIIDGVAGAKTRMAMAAFQASCGLEPTGELDAETSKRLGLDGFKPTRSYTLTKADASRVGPCPTDWIERSEAERMPFRSLLEVVAFEGHCTQRLIERLNPGIDVHQLAIGQTLVLPNVLKPDRTPRAAGIEIEFSQKQVRVIDETGRLIALFNCSIARQRDDRPQGDCTIQSIAVNPIYTFRPESWPEVKGIDRPLLIPPGPRNPVGLCWIDLSIDGYGIHGTPDPEMIGKTGSHGCIRMTNWDVLRLAEMVKPGMHVALVQGDEQVATVRN
ncbi:MAG: murein L,D-transpeptidase [Phycisphaerales bacterium]|nr:murein L,D-transpeptidase [Phycisphaerales bacterium]MCB9857208.1 murein L,D-transpeptidase [Phycisphaerales bacterium]MCB9863079.1 murein L,D-transpeptidase [Phycisphaerales bacterium]